MNKNFSLVLITSMFLFFFGTSSMDFYIIGETSYEELVNEIKNLKTYLSVLKEFPKKPNRVNRSKFNKRKHHVYISSSEDICLEQLTQSEE